MKYHACEECGKLWECDRELTGGICDELFVFGLCSYECIQNKHKRSGFERLRRKISIALQHKKIGWPDKINE